MIYLWLLAIIGIGLAIVGCWGWTVMYFRWRRLERLVDDLRAGLKPRDLMTEESLTTKRLATEIAALAEERDRLREEHLQGQFNLNAILSQMIEGVMVLDPQQKVRLINQSFLEMFDVMNASPLLERVDDLVQEMAVSEMVKGALEKGTPQSQEISPQASHYLSGSAVPFRDAAGTIKSVVVIFRDVTRIKQLEKVHHDGG